MIQEIEIAKKLEATLKQIEPILLQHHKEADVENIRSILADVQANNISILVCGEFKRGKSSFINAFLNEELCPTDSGIATSVVSIIKYGAERKVTRFFSDPSFNELKQEEIPFDSIENYAKGTSLEVDNTMMLVIEIPSSKLENGLTLIDTPGVGGLDPRHLYLTLYALPKADIVFFMMDAGEPMSSTELDFYKNKIIEYSKKNVIVFNKTDLKPKDEIDQLIRDAKDKISEYCGVEVPLVIPVSSTHWKMYNTTGSEKMRLSSHCDEVNEVISTIIPEYRKSLVNSAKDLLVKDVQDILQNVQFQLNQMEKPNEEDAILFNQKLAELKKIQKDIVTPTSELRKKITSILKDSQTSVMSELTHQSILFSTDCLDSLLKDERAKGPDGGKWALQQINLGLESLATEVDLKIDAGFDAVNEMLGGVIDIVYNRFTQTIQVDLTPTEKSFADKACGLARHSLPGLGVAGISNMLITTLINPVVGVIGGLALGAAFIFKTHKDSNDATRAMELKTKLAPQITVAMAVLKTYVQQRFDQFNDCLLNSLEDISNSIVADMQDVLDALKDCEKDKQTFAQTQIQLSNQIRMLDAVKKQTQQLMSNPY
jgi:GTPase SAR1 family protein